MAAGAGFALVDPHGDLVADILPLIPEHRVQDVIYFNPSDKDYVMPLNILAAEPGRESEIADALIVTFRRLVSSWGDRMEDILRNTVYSLLAVGGMSFADIRKILVNEEFRGQVVQQLVNPMLQDFWFSQFPNLPSNATQPIINKFSKFLNPFSTTQYIFTQPDTRLNFDHMMQGNKVFLANLSQGQIGLDTSHLLGTFLISQIQLAAMRRAQLAAQERN